MGFRTKSPGLGLIEKNQLTRFPSVHLLIFTPDYVDQWPHPINPTIQAIAGHLDRRNSCDCGPPRPPPDWQCEPVMWQHPEQHFLRVIWIGSQQALEQGAEKKWFRCHKPLSRSPVLPARAGKRSPETLEQWMMRYFNWGPGLDWFRAAPGPFNKFPVAE